jgi:hypothetical protein
MKLFNMKSLLVLTILVFVASSSFAGEDRIGTAGATELLIPFGSRGAALGSAVVSDASGVEAIYYNPAGIANVYNAEAMFTHLKYIADIDYNTAGLIYNTGAYGAFGITARALSLGEVIRTTEDQPNGTGETLEPVFLTVGLTYGKAMTDRINVGATVSYVNETLDRETATGLAFDFGVQYDLQIKGLELGIVLKNLGPDMQFDGPDFGHVVAIPNMDPNASPHTLRKVSAPFNLPTYLQLGIGYKYDFREKHRVAVYPSYTAHSFSPEEYNFGLEYAYDDMIFLRVGKTYADQEDYLWGMNYGFGVKYSNFAIDYTYGKVDDFFAERQWISIKFGM